MRVSMDQRLDIREGREVEVCYEENGFKAVWYKAIIEATKSKSGFIEHSVRLLKDDFATPLIQLSLHVLLRPLPPRHLQARISIKQGCVVDAYHKDGWWTGFVIKELKDDNSESCCLVFFDSPPDIILFERKDLRPHLKWFYKKWWVRPKSQLLAEESMFSPGTMVEVSSKTDEMEIVWVPAMIIKEIEEDDETKKYIVKFCNKPLSWEGSKETSNETVDSQSVRPKQPLFLVEEYKLLDCVEAFRGLRWRKGIVNRFVSQKSYMVSFEDTNKQLRFNHSDLRPPMEWEDGVWKL
ncbi:PREDICTED: DUF724 domain-containing protein 6-like [Camelina sativa]|uniref:DUF724 domain-containing protein 6-like n=1 Tax=Camelina sativa TaxID=90675 RepID=A0ABM1RSL6_CAMSA|nr:PREDICTED: DUF724 domain-containing protein 6-like [Camelina sativa]